MRQRTRFHGASNDGLVALNGQLDVGAKTVVVLLLPSDSAVLFDVSNVLVTLGVSRAGAYSRLVRRHDNLGVHLLAQNSLRRCVSIEGAVSHEGLKRGVDPIE